MGEILPILDSRYVNDAGVTPFVILLAGQSNAIGRDTSGDKINPANTFVTNSFMGGASLVAAQFGSAPFNLGAGGVGTSTDPALVCNNMAMHFANFIRRYELIPPSRPIVIVLNAQGGQPISQWVGNGTSSTYWVSLLASLAAVEAAYPGAKINHMIWSQGESDNSGSGSANNSKSLYLIGFATLLSQLRALAQWQKRTTLTVQELGDWPNATQRDRNDAIKTMRFGLFDPFVTTVPSYGIAESTDSPLYHFDGIGLATLGHLHFQTWLAGRANSGFFAPGAISTKDGTAEIWAGGRTISGAVSEKIGVEDLKAGSYFLSLTGAAGATITFPAASVVGKCDVYIYTIAGNAFNLASTSSIITESASAATTQLVNSGQGIILWKLTSDPSGNLWFVEAVNPRMTAKRLVIGPGSGARSLTALQAQFAAVDLTSTNLTLPSSGLKSGGSILLYGQSGVSTIIATGSVVFELPGGATTQLLTVSAGEWVMLRWDAAAVRYLLQRSAYGGTASQEATPASGATVSCKTGCGRQTIHLLHSSTIATLTLALPANPVDDQAVTIVATSAVTAVTWSGGTVGALVPSGLTAGQVLTLRYSAASSTWR